MMPFDPRGAARRKKEEGDFLASHSHLRRRRAAAIDWAAHAHAERVVSRGEERRALNLVNVCAVRVCRAEERDGMLTRERGREENGEIWRLN